eukprot:1666210-Rhodomonas_salina.1
MNTGDAVQWYFTFECDQFNKHGRREHGGIHGTKDQVQRYLTHMRENGAYEFDLTTKQFKDGKTPAAYPKPYRGNPLTD